MVANILIMIIDNDIHIDSITIVIINAFTLHYCLLVISITMIAFAFSSTVCL